MLLHLEELLEVKVDRERMLERADTPLAKLNQGFQDLYKEGFAHHKPKQQTRFSEAQTTYIKEIFDQGCKSRHAKPQARLCISGWRTSPM